MSKYTKQIQEAVNANIKLRLISFLNPKIARFIEGIVREVTETERKSRERAFYERNQLVSALTKLFPSYRSIHMDTENMGKSWTNIVYVELPTGQASWHIHDDDLVFFEHLQLKANNWDGHTTAEKYNRLRDLSRVF